MFVAPKGLVSGIRTFSIRENNHEVSNKRSAKVKGENILLALKEFVSSLLLIVSWVIFAISAYFLLLDNYYACTCRSFLF